MTVTILLVLMATPTSKDSSKMAGINLEGRANLVVEKERAQVVSTLKDMLELSRQSAEENAKAREEAGITESLAEPFVRDTGDMVRPEMRPVDMVPSELSDIIADESTVPLSEVDPAADIASDLQVIKQPDKDVAAPETSLRPQMRPDRLGDKGFKIVTNTSMKPTFTLTNASLLTKPEAPERMDSLLRGAFQTLQQNFGSELIINDALPKKGSTREKNTPNSRHFHGDALDVSVAGMSDSAKFKLVDAAKKAGFKGFGFGNNILHIDMGKNRGWSYGNDLFAGKPVSDLIAQIKAP